MTRQKYMTHWEPADTLVRSEYGTITYRDWCEREVKRICAGSVSAEVVECDGRVCIQRVK